MREVILKILKKLDLDFKICKDNGDLIFYDDPEIRNFPVSYTLTHDNILIKYARTAFFRKITLDDFKKIILRRAEMKTESDIDLLWKALDKINRAGQSFVLQWGVGTIPMKGEPGKTVWDAYKEIEALVNQHQNKVNQGKSIAKVSANLRKQVEEMADDKATKKSDI